MSNVHKAANVQRIDMPRVIGIPPMSPAEIDFSTATKAQLMHIATCDYEMHATMEDRYAATRELQARRFEDNMTLDLVRMYPTHTVDQLADYLGIPHETVLAKINQLGLTRTKARCADATLSIS